MQLRTDNCRRKRVTSEGDVGEAMLATEVDGVGEEAVEGLADHGEVGGVLEELEGGGGDGEGVLEEEVEGHPREAAEALDEEAEAQEWAEWADLGRSHVGVVVWERKVVVSVFEEKEWKWNMFTCVLN